MATPSAGPTNAQDPRRGLAAVMRANIEVARERAAHRPGAPETPATAPVQDTLETGGGSCLESILPSCLVNFFKSIAACLCINSIIAWISSFFPSTSAPEERQTNPTGPTGTPVPDVVDDGAAIPEAPDFTTPAPATERPRTERAQSPTPRPASPAPAAPTAPLMTPGLAAAADTARLGKLKRETDGWIVSQADWNQFEFPFHFMGRAQYSFPGNAQPAIQHMFTAAYARDNYVKFRSDILKFQLGIAQFLKVQGVMVPNTDTVVAFRMRIHQVGQKYNIDSSERRSRNSSEFEELRLPTIAIQKNISLAQVQSFCTSLAFDDDDVSTRRISALMNVLQSKPVGAA